MSWDETEKLCHITLQRHWTEIWNRLCTDICVLKNKLKDVARMIKGEDLLLGVAAGILVKFIFNTYMHTI